MTGRKPKPVEQRIREGNTEKRPITEPLLVAGRPDPGDPMLEAPEDLTSDGREAWDAIVPTLADVGLLDRVDRLALEAMCTMWARAKQSGRVVNRQGHLVRGANGVLREHPSLHTERQAFTRFLAYAEHYALTPVARTRLGLAELHRRALKDEFDTAIGVPDLVEIDGDAVEDESDG